MAIRTLAVAKFTTEAVADTTNNTDDKHYNLRGGSTTQYSRIKEVYAGGLEASTSSPQVLLLARVSQIGTGTLSVVTGTSDAADDPNTAALAAPTVFYTASATNKAQRLVATSGSYLANLAFNALGGLVRIKWPFGEEPAILGNAANNGEVMISGYTGTTGGVIGSHIKYETLGLLLAVGMSLFV